MPKGAVQDCRPSTEVRRWFAHAGRSGLRPCGSLELAATADRRATARRCVVESIERGEAFLIEQQLPATDRVVAYALLGAIEQEHGTLVVYRADYDAPSCSTPRSHEPFARLSGMNGCPIIRNLRLSKCLGAVVQPCSDDLSRCVRCDREDEFAACSLFDDREQPL